MRKVFRNNFFENWRMRWTGWRDSTIRSFAQYMRTTTVIIICFFFLKCSRVKNESAVSIPTIQNDQHATKVEDVITSMKSENLVEDEILGDCWAQKSEIYTKFAYINSLLTEAELLELTDHSKPNIRAYAFWFLARRQYRSIGTVYKKLQHDTSEIVLRYSDKQWIYKISDFCYFVLSPNQFDKSTIKLDYKSLDKLQKAN